MFQEKQAGTRDVRRFRVRIMSYRTQNNVIDGVVITFIDISEIKRLERGESGVWCNESNCANGPRNG